MNIFLENLVAAFTRLPGIGRQSAERISLKLIEDSDDTIGTLNKALSDAKEYIQLCQVCGNITDHNINPCKICNDVKRKNKMLCVVESPGDIIKIESSGGFKGQYHALMGRISPICGIGIDDLTISQLLDRINLDNFQEVFFALGTDAESEATVSYLQEILCSYEIKLTRIAFNLPYGASVEYADSKILIDAIKNRLPLR